MWFGIKLFILGVFCAVSARNFAMAFNRYMDEDIDRLNPRCANRPSVDGRIGRKNLIIFIIANACIFVLVAYFINDLAFWLSFPILIILGGYSIFKRFSQIAHIILGFCLGLAPIAGAVAISGEIPLWSALLCCGVSFWVGGFDILYSLQDMEYDKKAGLFSIPSIYGSAASMFISGLFSCYCYTFLVALLLGGSAWIYCIFGGND